MYATLEASEALATAQQLGSRGAPTPRGLDALEAQVCAEAGVWAPEAARRALGQSRGDVPRAVSLVRVWAAALPQLSAPKLGDEDTFILRRVSAAYADIPGGQWLGTAPELSSRLLRWDGERNDIDSGPSGSGQADASDAAVGSAVLRDVPAGGPLPPSPPTRALASRVRDLIDTVPIHDPGDHVDGLDPAGSTLAPPLDRPTRSAVLARAETGSLVSLAALTLARRREAILAEVTTSVAVVRVSHPRTGARCAVAEVPVVEAEAIVDADVDGAPGFAIGWGASLGDVERRAIAIALIDGALQADAGSAAATFELDPPTVVAATDGSATTGFVDHLRLPHYASFAAYVDQARRARPGSRA